MMDANTHNKYLINKEKTIIEALEVIDANKSGFVIVVDEEIHINGILSDGDIRRLLISGRSLDEKIMNVLKQDYIKLYWNEGIEKAIELFKDERIKFIPVIDDGNRVINVIKKKQLHAALLQDLPITLEFDFSQLDERIVDYEIYGRPWGFFKTTIMNDYCQAKIICVHSGERISLQSHERREEYWLIVHGEGIVNIGKSVQRVREGNFFFIPKGCAHRLTNTSEKENLIVSEVQIGDYFGEDDIHRYEDDYGRNEKGEIEN